MAWNNAVAIQTQSTVRFTSTSKDSTLTMAYIRLQICVGYPT